MTETTAAEKPAAPAADAVKPPADPKPATRRKPPAWYTQPQIVAAVALIVLIFELVGYALLGLVWLAVANLIAFAVLFALVQTWRRKGKGGLLDRLLSKSGRGRSTSRGGGSSGSSRSVFGGKGNRAPAGPGSGAAKAGGLRSRIPKVFGGTKGTAGPSPGGGGRGAPAGSGRGGGGSPSGRGPAAGGKPHRTGEAPLTKKPATAGPKTKKPGAKEPDAKPKTKTPGGAEVKDVAGEVPVPKHAKKTEPVPTAGTTEHDGDKKMTEPIRHSDDQSLQRWGKNLAGIEASAADVARRYAEAEAAKELHNQAVAKLRQQGENDLPVSKTLAADIEGVHTRATRAATADEWRAVVNDAATLPGTYHREHETDEDRLHVPRTSLAAEKRADVTTASQDN